MNDSGNPVQGSSDSAPGYAGTGKHGSMVDHGALKSNQLMVIALSLLAFVLDSAALAAGTALVMALGTVLSRPGFLPVYTRVLRPLGLSRPELLPDNPGPHRFAQGFGSVVLAGGAILLFAGIQPIGWALVWLVIFLAAVNAFAGFCAGCFLYYQLGRLGLAGFSQPVPEGTRAGFKPAGKWGR
jgi:hypothetical protein